MSDSMSQAQIDALLAGAGSDVPELSEFEVSSFSEFGNYAIGSGATTLSMILNKTVQITNPVVTQSSLEALAAEHQAPYLLVATAFEVGQDHPHVLMMNPTDAIVICDLMMGGDGSSPSPEIGEMQLSALGEAMNQTLSAAATTMNSVMMRRVGLQPPQIVHASLGSSPLAKEALAGEALTVVTYKLLVDGLIDSELIEIVPTRSARKMVEDVVLAADNPDAVAAAAAQEEAARKAKEAAAAVAAPAPQAEAEKPAIGPSLAEQMAPSAVASSAVAAGGGFAESTVPRSPLSDLIAPSQVAAAPLGAPVGAPVGAPAYEPAAVAASQVGMPAGYPPPGYGAPPPGYGAPPPGYGAPPPGYGAPPPGYGAPPPGYGYPPPQGYPQAPSPFQQTESMAVRSAQFAPLNMPSGLEGISGLDLILDVPLKVTVELGRTRMQIRDVLDLGKGSVVELDKLAGEPVDMLVNGKLIAKGEVVVIDENFGIRVTDIVSPIERFNNLKLQ